MKTGFAPTSVIENTEAENVKLGTITSSPFLIFKAFSAINAFVPLAVEVAYLHPQLMKIFSNFLTYFPCQDIHPF